MEHIGKNVGRNIRLLREWRNLTQEHVAHELGLSHSGYSRIERGEVEPDGDKLKRIASVLGVATETILNFSPSQLTTGGVNVQGSDNGQNMIHTTLDHIEDIYRGQIESLRNEVEFLRQSLRDKEKGR